jgi:DNA-binding NtrC family response regulator
MTQQVLVVDRASTTRDAVVELLGAAGGDVVHAASREAALAAARAAASDGRGFDVIIADPEHVPSAAAVRELTAAAGGARLLLLGGPEASAHAVRVGAFDVIGRPLVASELALRVSRAAPVGRAEKRWIRKSDVIVGGGAWVKELYDRIAMVAPTDATVAIYGESGTGKELVARIVHASSVRHEAPFVVVNCAAIPEALIEDELFGHVRGAYTDASRDREGLLAAADTGTLFLDEIGELPLALQAKLLRVLQSQEFRRIGDDQDRRVDVRIVTATNRDLEAAARRGTFRQDLYYRINVFPVHLPPLRERPEDLPLLVHHFLHKLRGRLGKPLEGFTPAALAKLAGHDFPGNVRELENKVHQAMVIAAGPWVEAEDVAVPAPAAGAVGPVDLARPFRELKQDAIDRFERGYLARLLAAHDGNLAAAARAAGMDRKNLWALVKRHGLR